ncbi:hypothetical protein D3C71_2038600 [compost metagenome]
MKGSAEGRLSNTMLTWPATASFSAGPEPRYGMWTTETFALLLYNSICRCPMLPVPAVAYEYFPGLFFSASTKPK